MLETKERNVYQELESLLSEMTMDITSHIMAEVVDSPLSALYEKLNAQIPVVESNNAELYEFIQAINAAKEQLQSSIQNTAQAISQVVIEKHVIEKLHGLFSEFQQHLSNLNHHSVDIDKSAIRLQEIEQHLTNKLETITSDVAARVLQETVMKDFEELYRQFDTIMPNLNVANASLSKTLDVFHHSVQELYKAIGEVSEVITEKVTGVISKDLKRTVTAYEQLVTTIKAKIPKLDVIEEKVITLEELQNNNFNQLSEKLGAINRQIGSLSKEMDKKFIEMEKKYEAGTQKILQRITVVGSITIVLLGAILFF